MISAEWIQIYVTLNCGVGKEIVKNMIANIWPFRTHLGSLLRSWSIPWSSTLAKWTSGSLAEFWKHSHMQTPIPVESEPAGEAPVLITLYFLRRSWCKTGMANLWLRNLREHHWSTFPCRALMLSTLIKLFWIQYSPAFSFWKIKLILVLKESVL